MYQFKGLDDTIVAIATASGMGGIGIIRLSGHDAITIADKVFVAKSNKRLSDVASSRIVYGWIKDDDVIVDEVLVTVMHGPKSYTTENVVEVNCHGGMVAMRTILKLLLNSGARLAEPGEFTKRAFIHGRIDLTQAEAVLDIINAKTESFLRMSTHQLKGELATTLEDIRTQLLSTYINLEAWVNFPEDDVNPGKRDEVLQTIQEQLRQIDDLLASSENGRLLKEGIRIVLCGKPNVGKSSLLNVLLKQQRAIVTDVAGTTRDVIEEGAQIKGIPFQLVDTAGILEPRDLIEEEAIRRSHLYIDQADLVLIVFDQSRSLERDDIDLLKRLENRNVLMVVNKADLPPLWQISDIKDHLDVAHILISAITKEGLTQLEDAIVDQVWQGNIDHHQGLVISNVRHINSLQEAQRAIAHAVQLMVENVSFEFVSEEIKQAVNALDAITGRNIDDDLLDHIFSDFCIGK